MLCQENEDSGEIAVQKILDVLYATEDGFEAPPDQEAIVNEQMPDDGYDEPEQDEY